jgi:hypothetical protein
MVSVSRIFGVVVWQFMCDDFGDLEMMSAQCVPSWRENTYYICGTSRAFGKGILDNRIYYISLILPWIFIQFLKGVMWSCWVGFCEVSLVGYELPFVWNNLLTPRKEILSEIDPLWSIEIRQHNLSVCKDFDEEVIFEANLCLNKTFAIHISFYMFNIRDTMKKIFPLFWWQHFQLS